MQNSLFFALSMDASSTFQENLENFTEAIFEKHMQLDSYRLQKNRLYQIL